MLGDTVDHNSILDVIRGATFTLYVIVVLQVFYIAYRYSEVIRMERKVGFPQVGLIPVHVFLLCVSLLGFTTQSVFQTIDHIGTSAKVVTFGNPLFLIVTVYGLHIIMDFEFLRYKNVQSMYHQSDGDF